MRIGGVDYSLTGPAICVYEGDGAPTFNQSKFFFYSAEPKVVKKSTDRFVGTLAKAWDHEIPRYSDIAQWAISCVSGCEVVFIEDYAYGAKGKVFHIAENIGTLKYHLYNANIPYFTIPPTVIKKQTTGKGTANKSIMSDAFLSETGICLWQELGQKKPDASPASDLVDAYYVMKTGYAQNFPEKSC